jgi:serine/threonine protein kinase
MARDNKSISGPPRQPKAGIDVFTSGEVALVSISGLVDEHFAGFGSFNDAVKMVVLNVAGMTRMTSFGVRQWLKAMDALPKAVTDLYLLSCPTFFVDQLNMVLNFGGPAQVLTVMAPYTCPSCGAESGEAIDVLAERAALAKGGVSEKQCSRCGGKLEFDETPESYFSFVNKYAATTIQPAAAQLLAEHRLYIAVDTGGEKPPKIIKLVHGSVTYFRIIGIVGSMFRARPFLVGAEGEVVIDLAEVERFDPSGQREWRRLLKTLSGQVPAVTLVDVNGSFLTTAGDSVALARNISVWSVLAPYTCSECGRVTAQSHSLEDATWPLHFPPAVCPTCGGTTRSGLPEDLLSVLQKAATSTPPASAKLIGQRAEILSRALTDANVAQAGDAATPSLTTDDTILGKYKIVRRLSAGGMAEVFVAKQVGIGGFEKPVALKRIQRQLLETRHLAIDMFLNEAKIAGRLMHPNIVQVLDVGEVGGALYLAMEFVRGKDLREINKKLRADRVMIPLGDACFVAHEVAQALHHAYWSTDMAGMRLNVVHRDVSPHNIILSYDGTVKLLDFGVAMSSVTEQSEKMIVGKWQYMSPESTLNQTIDHRSDLFSLGVVMYLLFTGAMPFTGSDPKEIVRKIRSGHYKALKHAAADIPEPLSALVDRMLSPNPDDRPQTGREIVTTLSEITRSYGIESSAANIASFMAQMFPEGLSGGEEATVVDLARRNSSSRMDIATAPTRIGYAPPAISDGGPAARHSTPSSGSPRPTPSPVSSTYSNVPIDASVSLPRRQASLPTMPPLAMPAPVPPLPPHMKVGGMSAITKALFAILLLAAVGIAAYAIFHSPA